MDLIPFGWDPFKESMAFPSLKSFINGGFPRVDLQENKNQLIIKADVPDIDPKKINVEVSPRSVKLSARIEEEKESDEENFYRKERIMSSFERVVPLPAEIRTEGVKAQCKNGTLTVTLEKKEPGAGTKVKKIPVEEA